MVFEFKFPDVGEGITEGEIVKWLFREGNFVKENEAIVQIETDKAVVDIPSPRSGVLLKIHFKEGETVHVGETLVTIGEKGEAIPAPQDKTVPEKKQTEKPARKSVSVVGELEEASEEVSQPIRMQSAFSRTDKNNVKALPRVRMLAQKLNVDITKVKGSGDDGRVTEDDVLAASQTAGPFEKLKEQPKAKIAKKYDMWGHLERIPLKGIRKTIAENMIKSFHTNAPVTSMIDIDITNLWNLREKEKIIAEKKGIKLTLFAYIIKTVIESLKLHPYLNSELQEEEIIIKKYYNIGVAVDTERGLIVPVIKRAEIKNLYEIAQEIVTLAEKVRDRTIDIMDLEGASFTITNYGSIGGTYGTPIINPPESAILGVGKAFNNVRLNKDKVENRKILPLSLTFDHRILDGAEAARFLVTLQDYLENPEKIKKEGDKAA